MYFKRIEMHGFKSFAEPVTIEFDRGITCVVGPNGSGKSNICDAIRWVLGAQSAKALRGDKMEDVIFAGTASRKSRGMAEVTLVIDNSQGELNIDYNEVAITRRMYRSGESEYLINNSQCRMKDIRELIMDTGIGVEGYSIIGQGKISDIISNNTESIREILEETAGIVMYRSKKAEAERKLSSASANMERVSDIIGEIEGRIDGLREDSVKAEEYLKLRDRHQQLEINITLKNIENIELKNEYIKDDITELKQKIDETKEKREALNGLLTEGARKREELDALIEEARGKQVAVIEEINALVNQGEIESERLAAIDRSNERMSAEIQELEQKIQREKENSSELFERKEQWDRKLAELSRGLSEKLARYEKETRALTDAERSIDEKKNRLFEVQRTISSKSVEITSIENLRNALDKRRETVVSEKDSGENSSRDSQALLTETEEQANRLKAQVEDLKSEKEQRRNSYNEAVQQERDLARKLEELRIEVGKLSGRKKTFEEMESNYEGYNNAVKFIMKKELAGIDGVVADLIKVPAGMEVAVETALGAKMQNIICEDDATAKQAIEQLKAESAGRLTFLPVNSIQPREMNRQTGVAIAPGFKGYGVDCIRFDEKYRKIIEYLLGNVIITDNMDNAVSLSKRVGRGYRIVTLEGEIINIGGAITGGKYRNKTANILERKAEIDRLAEQLNEMEKEQTADSEKLAESRRSMETALHEMSARDEEIIGREREYFAKENEIKIIKTSLSDFETNSEKWHRELDNIEEERKNSEDTAGRLRGEVEEAERQAETLQRELEAETSVYEAEKSRLEGAGSEITEARIAVSSCESEKAKVDAVVDKVNEAMEGFENEQTRKQELLTKQSAEKEELTRAYEANAGAAAEKKKEKENIDIYLKDVYEEKNDIIRKYEEANAEKDQLDETSLALSNQKNELDIKQARQDTQLENAKSKLWEEFEISYMQAIDYRDEEFVMSAAVKENREIKKRMRELGEVNVGAIEEYKTVNERYEFLTEQKNDITKSMEELTKIISDMDKVIRSRFKESFDQVVVNFESVFRELYGGGHAKISLGDESDPFESEIEITAQPPGKQLKNINLLSGGEKTMTAIALMFAVLKTKPTPCCVLDEVEAALDDSNLDIFGNYVRKFGGVQFTLITHQKTTMEHADVMYGITMPESGVSKVYSLRMDGEAAEA